MTDTQYESFTQESGKWCFFLVDIHWTFSHTCQFRPLIRLLHWKSRTPAEQLSVWSWRRVNCKINPECSGQPYHQSYSCSIGDIPNTPSKQPSPTTNWTISPININKHRRSSQDAPHIGSVHAEACRFGVAGWANVRISGRQVQPWLMVVNGGL